MDDDKKIQDAEDESIKRAELLYDYQVSQFELALSSVRRLEDKATKMLGFMSLVITTTLLITRYWWKDIFEGDIYPVKVICWISLLLFFVLSSIAWGFSFSAMQIANYERPQSSIEMTKFFIKGKRYKTITEVANGYSYFTDSIDETHSSKVAMINKSSEAILFSAYLFISFVVSFIIIKFTA